MKFDPATIRFIQYVYANDIEVVINAMVSQIIFDELKLLLFHYTKEYLGSLNLKSINFIDNY